MSNTYDDNVKKWKEVYTKILEVCGDYGTEFSNVYSFEDIKDMTYAAKDHLRLIEWYEKYGLKISHNHKPVSYNYFRVNDYLHFSYYADSQAEKDSGNGGRYISWSDDDRQPMNEWLLNISYPTGAYIFGDDYDYNQTMFQDMIKELKSYKPDYSDTTNDTFYWKLENAKPIYDDFNEIMKKYRERSTSEEKLRKAAKLRKELERLEKQL